MPQPLIITLASPREVRGWHDGSRAAFTTDKTRAKLFQTHTEACLALEALRLRFPRQALYVRPLGQTGPKALAWGWFAAGLFLAGLAGCAHHPLSSSDCGRHFTGGTGLLGIAGAMGAFDREAGPDCPLRGYAVNSSGYIPPNDVRIPPDPALLPLPDNRQRLIVPAGGGNYMVMP